MMSSQLTVLALVVHQLKLRAADRAGVGLGVEAAVQRVFVFPLAVGAHLEDAHGGQRPVVGDVLDDGEARAAVGAVGEGIAVAAVALGENFLQAGAAGGDIRRDELVFARLGYAVADFKALVAGGLIEAD